MIGLSGKLGAESMPRPARLHVYRAIVSYALRKIPYHIHIPIFNLYSTTTIPFLTPTLYRMNASSGVLNLESLELVST